MRRVETVQQQVHLAEQIRQRLRLAAEDATPLAESFAMCDGLHLFAQMIERLDEKAARAAAGSSTVSPSRGSVTSTMKRTTGRGV